MATSGSVNTSSYKFVYDQTRYMILSWKMVSQSVANNTSEIFWELKGGGTYQYGPTGSDFHVEIDGETVYDQPSTYRVSVFPDTVVATGTKTITHDADGSKTFTVYVEAGIYSSPANCSGSGSFELPAIPRASEITSAENVTLGNKCSISWVPKATAFRYKLKFSIGPWSATIGAIHPNRTTEYTYTGYTIPLEVAKQIPNAATGTMKVELYTYSDSSGTTQVGSADSVTFTVTVPDNSNTKPAVTMELTPVSSLPAAFSGLYIQGFTKVKAVLGATGKYGAAIDSYSMKAENKTYDSDDGYTSGYLTAAGSVTIYGYAKDSRGFTGSASQKITVIGYSKPKILPVSGETEVVAARCDSDGNLTDSGTYLKIKAKRSYSAVKSGNVQKNFCAIQYRYKLESAAAYSAWTTILAKDSLASDEVETSALLGGVLSVQHTYLVQVRAVDDIGESGFTTLIIPTDTVYMHRARNAMGLGKYVEVENLLDVAWDTRLRGEVRIGSDGKTLKEYILAVISEGG